MLNPITQTSSLPSADLWRQYTQRQQKVQSKSPISRGVMVAEEQKESVPALQTTPSTQPIRQKKKKIDSAKIKKILYIEYPKAIKTKVHTFPKPVDGEEEDSGPDEVTGVIGQRKYRTHVTFLYEDEGHDTEITRTVSFGINGIEDYIDKGDAKIGQFNIKKLSKYASNPLRGNYYRTRLLNACPKMRQAYFNLLEELDL
jgi:hypothetical protein